MIFLLLIAFLAVAATLALIIITCFYLYRRFVCHRYFNKLNIPGPEPHWFYGNLLDIWSTEHRHLLIQQWSQTYGKFFGYYEGSTPILVTSSDEAIERLCVKQFNSFPGRKIAPVQPNPHKYPDSPFANMGSVYGERWKRLRTIVNPGFSTGKLKSYAPLIEKSQMELLNLLADFSATGQSFNIEEQFQYLTLDVISEVAFGIELNSIKHRGADNPILPRFKRLLASFVNEPAMIRMASCIPELVPFIEFLIVFQMKFFVGVLAPFRSLAQVCEGVIQQRRSDPALRRSDLLQMMIDASNEAKLHSEFPNICPPLTPLSDHEIVSQSIQFFGAGYGTTSATLAYAAYRLAKHQDCQEKLFQEIISYFPVSKVDPDYDTIMHKMPYLDWFIHEVIRLHPIAIFVVNRFAAENTQLCGIPVTKGKTRVFADMWSMHHNVDFWGPVNPDKFYPERFSPDYPTTSTRPDCAFLGFGYGPRYCLGTRLALFEMKLTLINVIRRFRMLEADECCPHRELKVKVTRLMMPSNGVWVRLADRQNKLGRSSENPPVADTWDRETAFSS